MTSLKSLVGDLGDRHCVKRGYQQSAYDPDSSHRVESYSREDVFRGVVHEIEEYPQREEAWRELRKRHDPRSVPLLIAELSKKTCDQHTKFLCVDLLGYLGDTRAIEPLLALWRTLPEEQEPSRGVSRFQVQRELREILKRLREKPDATATSAVISTLAAGSREIKIDAVVALRESGDSAAIEPLLERLTAFDGDVYEYAAAALERLGWVPTNDTERGLLAIGLSQWDRVAQLGNAAIEPLIAALKHGIISGSNRHMAFNCLIVAGWQPASVKEQVELEIVAGRWNDVVKTGGAAVPILVAALKAMPDEGEIIAALGRIGTPEALDALRQIAERPSTYQSRAIDALAKSGSKDAITFLSDRLSLDYGAAANVLERIGWQPDNDRQRAQLAISQGKWDDIPQLDSGETIPVLIDKLSDPDKLTRKAVLKTLETIDGNWLFTDHVRSRVPEFIRGLDHPKMGVRRTYASLLGQMREKSAVESLIAWLADPNYRETAARVLGEIGDARASTALGPFLSAEDPSMRTAAATALERIGGP